MTDLTLDESNTDYKSLTFNYFSIVSDRFSCNLVNMALF